MDLICGILTSHTIHIRYSVSQRLLLIALHFNQMDDALKNIYHAYFEGNEKEFVLLLNSVGKYGLKAVDNAVKYLQKTCPTNISVDKIEFLCTRKNYNKIIYLSDYNDEITANSFNMLNEFNDLLK